MQRGPGDGPDGITGAGMRTAALRALAGWVVLAMLVLPAAARAQSPVPFSGPQLERLLAPIALYPDALLGQILMAATYPMEVIEAARWSRDPRNAGLAGEQLAAALEVQDWDPSVKSLVPFPRVLQMMDAQLAWMQQLGDAFLAQPDDVMAAVQRLRARAVAAGTLASTPEWVVRYEGAHIIIVPARPQVVFVPYYDVQTVYGVWPYPAYPPFAFLAYPVYGSVAAGIHFDVGITVLLSLWGWDHFDWRLHRLHIDARRYNALNRAAIERDHRPRVTSSLWVHDPFHRRGVAYRDPRSRQRFLPGGGAVPPARREFRGFQSAPAPALRPRSVPAPVRVPAPRPNSVAPRTLRPGPQSGAAGTLQRQAPPRVQTQRFQPRPPREAPPRVQTQRSQPPPRPPRQAPQRVPPQVRRPSAAPPVQRSLPPAFGGIDQGARARRDAVRGYDSRRSATPPQRRSPGAAPATRAPRQAPRPGGRQDRTRRKPG